MESQDVNGTPKWESGMLGTSLTTWPDLLPGMGSFVRADPALFLY